MIDLVDATAHQRHSVTNSRGVVKNTPCRDFGRRPRPIIATQ